MYFFSRQKTLSEGASGHRKLLFSLKAKGDWQRGGAPPADGGLGGRLFCLCQEPALTVTDPSFPPDQSSSTDKRVNVINTNDFVCWLYEMASQAAELLWLQHCTVGFLGGEK